LWFYRSRLRLF